MKYRLAIFDFDGTLADSFPFFVRVFNQLAAQHGFRGIAPEQIPLCRNYSPRQMMELVGMPKWKLPLVARSFIALMKQNASSIALFDEVSETLRHLAEQGVVLTIVTSNSYENVSQILGPANLKLFREFECGMSMFGKAGRIQKVLKRTGIPAHEALCIGDQIPDLEAARKANVPFGAVAWGYGTIESLRAHAPEEEFAAVAELKKILG